MGFGRNIVTIGGGTGSFTILSGLKRHTQNLTAIVGVWDDGGSSGKLRDEFGVLPPGDLRQAILALLEEDETNQQVRAFFNARLTDATGDTTPWGNRILAGMELFAGSNAEAVRLVSRFFRITGTVIPVSGDQLRLQLTMPDGHVVRGESELGEDCAGKGYFVRGVRPDLAFERPSRALPEAVEAILGAEAVVLCPGKLFTSVGPHLLFDEITDALIRTRARVIYASNLMTQPGQTDGYGVTDFPAALEALTRKRFIDDVIYNTAMPRKELVRRYAGQGEKPVRPGERDDESPYRLIGRPLLSREIVEQQAGDMLQRTLIRHDPEQLARAVMAALYTR